MLYTGNDKILEVIIMKEIIDEISRIDAIAYENEQKNRLLLYNEKLRLENEMKKYREHRLKEAEETARMLYERIAAEAQRDYQIQEEKNRELSLKFDESYSRVEKEVIAKLMEKLFP